jgi:hypothetical protein
MMLMKDLGSTFESLVSLLSFSTALVALPRSFSRVIHGVPIPSSFQLIPRVLGLCACLSVCVYCICIVCVLCVCVCVLFVCMRACMCMWVTLLISLGRVGTDDGGTAGVCAGRRASSFL